MKVQLSLRVSPELHARLKAAAEADVRSLHGEVVWLIEEALTTRDNTTTHGTIEAQEEQRS